MIILTLVAMVTISKAQRGQRPPNLEQRIERAEKELGLSESQVEAWKAVHTKYENELKASRSERRSIHEKMEKELEAILDEEQKAKFLEMRENRGRRRQE